MRTRPNIDQLILDIHAAPQEPGRWHAVVDSMRRALSADRAFIFSVPAHPGEEFWHIGSEMDPASSVEYAQEFAPEDVWMLEAKRRKAQVGLISTGEELIDRSVFLRTRFFNEFLARHDIDRFLNVLLRDRPGHGAPVPASFSFYRGLGRPAFGEVERTLLGRMTPHLVLALDSFWKSRALSLQNAMLARTLDAVTAPLFLVDRLGHIVFANHAAATELRSGECLRTVDGCLSPSREVRDPRGCVAALQSLRAGRGGTAALTNGNGVRRVILSTAPLSEIADTSHWGAATGLIWLTPPQSNSNPAVLIAELFGLTAAEERLLKILADGASLTEAAATLHVSIHTARTQLKSVQQKSGWHTQSELARMVQQVGVIDPRTALTRSRSEE
jgi:DNA-binding CsgD family transcriptional regulator/PAS domain-containing protein